MKERGVRCIDCHMPQATCSAIRRGLFTANLRAHLFRINLDPKAEMFYQKGKLSKGFLTLKYVCLPCHGG